MSISYNIYGNDAAGGPIDYSTVLTNTASLTYALPALSVSSDNLFAVRALDSVTGLEESNVDAVVRIVIDAAGNDVSNRPAPPVYVSAVANSGGKSTASWSFNHVDTSGGNAPTGFKVWLTAGSSVDYTASPAVTLAYHNNPSDVYTATLTGLVDGTTYTIGVRTYNATGLSVAADESTVVGRVTTPPDAPDDGSSSVGFAP